MPEFLSDSDVGLSPERQDEEFLTDADVGIQATDTNFSLDPYSQARMKGQVTGPMEPFGPVTSDLTKDIWGPIVQAELEIPPAIAGAIGKGVVGVADIPTRIANWSRGASPGVGPYVPTLSELPRPQLPTSDISQIGPNQTGLQIAAGLGNLLSGVGNELIPPFAPPEVGLTLPLLGGEGAIPRLASGIYGAAAVSGIPDQLSEAHDVLSDPNAPLATKIQAVGQPALNAAFGVGMLRHAVKPKGLPDASRIEAPTEVHGDVRPQPIESPGQMPLEESRQGVQPQTQEVAQGAQVPLTEEKPKPTLTPGFEIEGKPFTGRDHAEARLAAARAGLFAEEDAGGFFDENGKFLNREEAAKRFEEMTGKKPPIPNSLRSENLRDEGMLGHMEEKTGVMSGQISDHVKDYLGVLASDESPGGTDRAITVGLKAKTIADLEILAQARKELIEASKSGNFASAFKSQYPREAIEVATNVGGHIEGEGLMGKKGKRPLDWRDHPEVADWLRKNAKEIGIVLPEEMSKAEPIAESAKDVPRGTTEAIEGKSLRDLWPGLTEQQERAILAGRHFEDIPGVKKAFAALRPEQQKAIDAWFEANPGGYFDRPAQQISDLAGDVRSNLSELASELTRLIRQAGNLGKDAAQEAQKIFQDVLKKAKEQGVSSGDLEKTIKDELVAVFGRNAAEMASFYFGKKPELPATKPATPDTFSPEHLDFDHPAAWSPVSVAEASDPLLLSKKLGEVGRGRVAGALESLTKTLLAMVGKDGKVHVVSTYTPGRAGPRVVDPAKAKSSKPNRQLRDVLKDYTPQYVMRLKGPVRNFHKVYGSMEDFFNDFGNEARDRQAGIKAIPEPPRTAAAPVPLEAEEQVGLTDAESASLHEHIGKHSDPGEMVAGIEASANKQQIRSAFQKAIDAIQDQDPKLTQDQAAAKALKQYYELHEASKDAADFHKRSMAALGQGVAETTATKPTPATATVPTAPKAAVQVTTKPPPPGAELFASFFAAPAQHPLGPVSPGSVPANAVFGYFSNALSKIPEAIQAWWKGFSMQTLPKITAADRPAGEAGARYASSGAVARSKGLEFADTVTDGIKEPLFDTRLGSALVEDNLRSIRNDARNRAMDLKRKSDAAYSAGDQEQGLKLFDEATVAARDAGNVTTLIGAEHSPFATEADYQRFLASPSAQAAIAKHIQLWNEQKDPIFRKANDLDIDAPLETRGYQTGARINLKAVMQGEGTKTTVGPAARPGLIRQSATFLRKDPFARKAKGTGLSYEGSYREIMANGYQREYPVAAQHDFIKALIDSGDAKVTSRAYDPDLQIKGERAQGYELKLRPWAKEGMRAWLQVRKSLAKEYEDATGLASSFRIPVYSPVADVLTKQSILGLAEGSTHVANLFTQVFTGLGPTANPMLNALIKSAGRADILWQLPKVLIKGFTNQKSAMLKLAEIGAAKDPYRGTVGWLITKVDQGVRLNAAETYKRMAAKGWVPDTETGLREYVNQVGQYNKALQPRTIRFLRETGVNPFATAQQTFLVQGLRNIAQGPGAEGTSMAAKLALRADKAAGLIGFVVLVTAINKMVSGSATGPKGTALGSVGWIGDDGKLKQFNLSRLMGYDRGMQATGIGPYIEAKRLGFGQNAALRAGVQGPARTALNFATGPLNRTMAIGATGSRPGVPMVQEAPVVPPRDDMAPLKSQAVQNVLTALQEVNPVVDAIARYKQGKPVSEIAERQLSRYTPRTGMSQETIAALPKITKAKEMQDYVDALAKEARKLPLMQRAQFIQQRLAHDEVTGQNMGEALRRLRLKGVYKFE